MLVHEIIDHAHCSDFEPKKKGKNAESIGPEQLYAYSCKDQRYQYKAFVKSTYQYDFPVQSHLYVPV
jgi:hypothetical protein